jgi:hypothetical protein
MELWLGTHGRTDFLQLHDEYEYELWSDM